MRNRLLGLLLAFTFVALGQAKAMPKAWPNVKRAVKGGIHQLPTRPEAIAVDNEIDTLGHDDDKTKDPDWVAPDDLSDYEESYDPDWLIPDEFLFYEDSSEHTDPPVEIPDLDIIWLSDEDHDYVPYDYEGGYNTLGSDYPDSSDDDPDYVPDYSQLEESDEDEEEQYADDVDDTDEGDYLFEDEDEQTLLDSILLQIAILEVEKEDPEGLAPDMTDNYLKFLQQLGLTIIEAEAYLSFLQAHDDSDKEVEDTEQEEQYDDQEDSLDDDPDYIPDYSQLDDEDDYDDLDYDGDDGSDDDDYDSEEYVEDELDNILLEIALLQNEKLDPEGVGPDKASEIFEFLKGLNLSLEEAQEVLTKFQEGSVTEQDIGGLLQQHQAPSVKGKRQTKSLSSQQTQQSGQSHYYQVDQPAHIIGVDQGNPVVTVIQHPSHADVSDGVVPVDAVVVGGSHGVSQGVESVDEESDSGGSFIGWLGAGWNHISDAADTIGDHIEEKADDWGDKISGAFGTVQDVASDAVDKVQDAASSAADAIHGAAHSAGDTIVSTYHKVKGKIPELRARIRSLFSSFSRMVQEGADYCIYHLGSAVNQVREAELLDKLQQKLAEGNEEVTQFFTLLGEKISSWRQTHDHNEVDSGLIIVGGEGTHGEHIDASGVDREQVIPNLFQDQDIIVQLNQMVNSGVITQEDLDLLSQQTTQEVDFLPNPYQQDSSAIQVQSHPRRLRHRAKRHHHAKKFNDLV